MGSIPLGAENVFNQIFWLDIATTWSNSKIFMCIFNVQKFLHHSCRIKVTFIYQLTKAPFLRW